MSAHDQQPAGDGITKSELRPTGAPTRGASGSARKANVIDTSLIEGSAKETSVRSANVIVLDSNQLRSVLPATPALRLLEVAAKRAGHTLATTDVVIREVTRQRRDGIESAIRQLRKAQKSFNKAVQPGNKLTGSPFDKLTETFVGEETERFEAELRKAFDVLETTPDDAREALIREAGHQAPCLTGAEGRDASIWLTALRASRTTEVAPDGQALPTIFVSEDSTFCGPDERIAPALLPDVPEGAEVLLCRKVIAVMDTLGFPTQWTDVSPITDTSEFQEAVVAAVALAGGPILVGHLGTQAMTPPRLPSGYKGQQCQGEGVTMTSVSGQWKFQVIVREPILDSAEARSPGYTVQVDGEALVTQDDAGDITDVTFSPHVITTSSF